MKAAILSKFKENWKSGVTVALISLPLSIALSIASGAGPVPGIITGFWATIISGFFGGSNYNVIGVAGALSTILLAATLYEPVSGPWILPFIALVTGLIIFAVYLLRFEKYLRYIPSSVMYGFATGVAVLIAYNQVFDAFGLSFVKKHGEAIADFHLLLSQIPNIHWPSFGLFAVFLAFLVIWRKKFPKFPGVILASVFGTIVGVIAHYVPKFDYGFITLNDKFGEVKAMLWSIPNWSQFAQVFSSQEQIVWLIQTSIVVAMVAVLETLITARIGDKLTGTYADTRKELFGLSLANLGSGILGGLPATGVFVRTGANIRAGATHKTSQIIAAVVTLLLALVVMPFFQYMPLCVIAAILFNTAIGLIEADKFHRFWHQEKASFIVGMVVAITTVVDDAGFGVMLGVILALLLFINRVSEKKFEATFNTKDAIVQSDQGKLKIPDHPEVDVMVYTIAGFLGYVDGAEHLDNLRKIQKVPTIHTVVIRLRNLFFIDLDGIDYLADAIQELQKSGKKVCLSSVSLDIQEELKKHPTFQLIFAKSECFSKTEQALAHVRSV